MQDFPLGQKFDASGHPLNGGLAYFRLSGTTTAATVYADSALVTPLAYPVVADSAGRFPAVVYLDPTKTYRYNLYRAGDGLGTSLESADPINTTAGAGGINGADIDVDTIPGDRLADGAIEAKLGYTPEDAATVFANARLANMADGLFKGRHVGAGTGPPEDLTEDQACAMLDLAKILSVTSNFATNGYITIGGFIFNWGYYAGGSSSPSTSFDLAFPTVCYGAIAQPIATGTNTETTDHSQKIVSLQSAPSTSSASWYCTAEDKGTDTFGTVDTTCTFFWLAWGR